MTRFDQCSEDCTTDCGHCKGRPVAALRGALRDAFDRANEAARLSAEARDHVEELRKQIETLREDVAVVEGDRLDRDAWAVRVSLEHDLSDEGDLYEAIAKHLRLLTRDRDRLIAAVQAFADAAGTAGMGSAGATLLSVLESVTGTGDERDHDD